MPNQVIKHSEEPQFWVRDLPIYGRSILSPMDGFSDLPFRSIARELGSAMSYTEFVNALDVLNGHPHLEQRLSYLEMERPIVFQIFDDDPARLLKAAQILRERNPDMIDINMGCSARTVSGRGAGAGLLREPKKIARIFRTISKALDIPITGKIRIGWDDEHLNYLEVAQIVEDNGGALLAVHGRTKEQAYRGQSNWEAIAEIKDQLSIPVIGNGDVRVVADIDRMRASTGVDGVMIARAAIGNPWIFARKDRETVNENEVRNMMLAHLIKMKDYYGSDLGLVLFRKHAARYLSPYRLEKEARRQFLTSRTEKEFLAVFENLADRLQIQ